MSQTLEFPADENGTDDVSDDEEKQEDIVSAWMSPGIEDSQEDQSSGSDERENHGEAGEPLLEDGDVPS